MGMGLAIARWIVEAHQAGLARTIPAGAVFSFTLRSLERVAMNAHDHIVFVVDDDFACAKRYRSS